MTVLRFAILTVSDRSARAERPDSSGPALEKVVIERDWIVVRKEIVPDEKERIQELLTAWSGKSVV